MTSYWAIDLGTTGCRSILYNECMEEIASAYCEYGLITPSERCVEQDAELWWLLAKNTLREALCACNRNANTVASVSISSQGITLVPVDKSLSPLCNAMSWLDTRAVAETEYIKQVFGEKAIRSHTGKPTEPAYTLPKILWLRNNRPEIYSSTFRFLMPMDFLIAKLTGICVTDHTMASGTMMYDIRNSRWSESVLEKFDLDIEKLPKLVRSGERVGNVLPEICEELGLRSDCAVVAGAQDQRCASLGAGLREGVMTLSLGTAAALCRLFNKPAVDELNKVGWSAYLHSGEWVAEGVVNTASVCLRWLRDLMFQGDDYTRINIEAAEALERGGSLMFYPYLSGPSSPDYYPNAQGSFYGAHLGTQRGDFALAVMEGVAFQVKILLEVMDPHDEILTLSVFGGGSKSPLWCQILADVTERQIEVPKTVETAGLGAAILASWGVGASDSHNALTDISRVYTPGERIERYRQLYKEYRKTEHKLWGDEKQ